ncbi:B-block binding subunit of TFIIIC [Phytophthora cinnamomi]|uniref:B-block binding subunit of TFIIIC n=1 Tax=Phytophthora cinnamomi TaxID=4785 RepID=UPI00355AB9EC|nr:B-block binding subunit of TFIIIC [Phytophthora cinnamomi]
MAVKCSMPQFVARCLEEIGLEGRCGLPLRALFDAMDPQRDVAYRRYAWRVLRGMEGQLSFHVMRPLEDKQLDRKPLLGAEDGGASTPRRKRKWKTTLLASPSGESPAAKGRADDEADRTPKRLKHKSQPLQPVLPSMRRIAAQKQRRRLSDADCETRGDKVEGAGRLRRRRQGSSDGHRDGDVVMVEEGEDDRVTGELEVKEDPEERRRDQTQTQQQTDAQVSIKQEAGDAADETRWVLRSPRGYRLGDVVDVGGLSYEEAVTSNQDGVLGVVACEALRLKYLGVQDASLMDTISPQFDLLEIIGRARVRGENAAALTNSRLFGDSRKLHYLLDMLIVSNYVVKNIITADQRRFNIVHLRRQASRM